MKRFLLLYTILFFSGLVNSQPPYLQWVITAGGVLGEEGRSMAVDKNQNNYITGMFQDTADFDPGPGIYNMVSQGYQDIFIVKYDSLGSLVWAKQIGGIASMDEGITIALDSSNNIYVAGQFEFTADFDPGPGINNMTSVSGKDIYILKLDSDGNFIWSDQIGGLDNQWARSLALDGMGNIYLTGIFAGSCDFDPGTSVYNFTSAGDYDIFVLKLNATGVFQWAKQIGSWVLEESFSLVSDSIGNVYISGEFSNTVDFDPGPLTYNLTSPSFVDYFLLKLDSGGNFDWVFALDAGGNSVEHSLNLDNKGHIYALGYYSDTLDFDPGPGVYNLASGPSGSAFILKLDTAMNFVSVKLIQSGNELYLRSATIDKADNLYICGSFDGTYDFDPGSTVYNLTSVGSVQDMFILKLDSLGVFSWVKHIHGGSSANSQASAITISYSGEIYTMGSFALGIVDFDPGSGVFNLSPFDGHNIFLHKLGTVPVGISEYLNGVASLSVFPNPTSNNLTIETIKPTNISIVNLLGQELFNSKIEKSQTIDVSFLSNGIYFVKDLQNGGSIKFIKQ